MHQRHTAITGIAALMAATAVAGCSAAAATGTQAAPAATAGRRVVISSAAGPFGRMLIVGSGRYKGYTLYGFTSDYGKHTWCTAKVIMVFGRRGSCTGPLGDPIAHWPALTTTGRPIAGRGVNPRLLGTIYRPGVGRMVVYAGHPLYLFYIDRAPFQVTGQGWFEPGTPPWRGIWWLVAPSGAYLAWPETLTWARVRGRQVLATLMSTGVGVKQFPVYVFSKDSSSTSRCYGQCAVAWPPLITSGVPGFGPGLTPSDFGRTRRTDGTWQVTYFGRPLYVFFDEVFGRVGYAAKGNGNGIVSDGGRWSLVYR
jgi:predicted lipoprotein with Yx(FWY)xxD motif